MGYGELSLLFVMWKLRTIERDSVLVLEEPEAHVSPRSQRALMDILARSCDEKGLSIILTTHSPTIIANLPQDRIVLISKGQNGQTSATVGPSKISVKELLGESALKRALILVEDRAAVQFGVSLLEQTSVDILSQVEFLEAGSAAKIDLVLSNLPRARQGTLKVIGVYDGDMRTRVNSRSFNWPHFFCRARNRQRSFFETDCSLETMAGICWRANCIESVPLSTPRWTWWMERTPMIGSLNYQHHFIASMLLSWGRWCAYGFAITRRLPTVSSNPSSMK
nr:AAA family ATPase [Burkholderia multivorans]